MSKNISFRWKKDFSDIPWYKNNPADSYLSDKSKVGMLKLYILKEEDYDSEAECFIIKYPDTNKCLE